MSETKEHPSRDGTPRKTSSAAPAAPERGASPIPRQQDARPGGPRSRTVEVLIAKRDGLLHPQTITQIAQALDALPDSKSSGPSAQAASRSSPAMGPAHRTYWSGKPPKRWNWS
jgi:hypothetical protein